jgi:hypothetical protein
LPVGRIGQFPDRRTRFSGSGKTWLAWQQDLLPVLNEDFLPTAE